MGDASLTVLKGHGRDFGGWLRGVSKGLSDGDTECHKGIGVERAEQVGTGQSSLLTGVSAVSGEGAGFGLNILFLAWAWETGRRDRIRRK